MLNICFSQEDIKVLFKERYLQPHPWVQRRMEALYLKSQGVPHEEIRRLIKISTRTLVQWIRMYQEESIAALKLLRWKGAKSALKEHKETLENYFKKHPPISLNEACAKIKELTGMERRRVAVRDFLRSLGMSFRKTGNVPGKATVVKQGELKKRCSPCLRKQKKENDRCLLFVDAAHFVWAGFVGFLWCA